MSYLSNAPAGGAGTGTVTQVNTGTGLTGGPITTTGTISLTTELVPMATLTGNALKVLRVNAGETAVEYAAIGTGDVVGPASAVDGQMAVYDGTTGKIIEVFAPTLGSALFAGASGIPAEDNTNYFWDNTNKRLGVGVNSPLYTLHVKGSTAGGHALFERTTSATNSVAGVGRILSTSTGDMADGFGPQLAFEIQDTAAVENQVAFITATRANSSDTTANLNFLTSNAGSSGTALCLGYNQNVAVGSSTVSGSRLDITGTRTAANTSNVGVNLCVRSATFTDSSSSGTVSVIHGTSLYSNTFAASSSTTYTDASTVYINGAPTAGTNVTLTSSWALWVDSGETRLDGNVRPGANILPQSNDVTQLGSTTLNIADIFLATGAVINYNAGNYTLTHSSGLLTASGAFSVGTSNAITTGTLEVGNASDTTLSRSAAGVLAVEGVVIPSISSTNTLTNKRVTPRVSTTTSSATPTINTDNVDMYGLTAQTADITSFTTNLSGTPTDGQKLWIYIVGTAARAITWGTSFEASTIALPTTTVSTNRLDVGFVWNAATSKWRCVATC